MAVRSNYIKNLMDTKKTLEEQMQEVISESMKGIIGDNAKEEVRKLLKESEDEDSFTEEEVNDDTVDTKEEDNEKETSDDVASIEGTEDTEEDSVEEDSVEDDIWNDLDACKTADGEFDCRGMDSEKLLKVFKEMGPEDGIRVMKNEDGTIAVEVDGNAINGEEEFVVDVDDIDNDDEIVYEITTNECNESNTGYTDDYQKKTAMTTPSNHEPANPKATISVDKGVPTGVEKPYAYKGDNSPYSEIVESEIEVEVETDDEKVNEVASTTENNPAVRGTGMTHANTNRKGKVFRSSSEGGVRVKGTGKNSYSDDTTNESIDFKRKVNKLYEENKQMKSLIPDLQKKLQESMVINASMGYIVRLLNENAVSVDEKKEITSRFSEVTTLEESKKLFENISKELQKVTKTSNVNNIFNSQLAENKKTKQSLVEKTMYKSNEVNEALNFMQRLDKIK